MHKNPWRQTGVLVLLFPYGSTAEDIAADLDYLLTHSWAGENNKPNNHF